MYTENIAVSYRHLRTRYTSIQLYRLYKNRSTNIVTHWYSYILVTGIHQSQVTRCYSNTLV